MQPRETQQRQDVYPPIIKSFVTFIFPLVSYPQYINAAFRYQVPETKSLAKVIADKIGRIRPIHLYSKPGKGAQFIRARKDIRDDLLIIEYACLNQKIANVLKVFALP